jgi:hypothetical protein
MLYQLRPQRSVACSLPTIITRALISGFLVNLKDP